MATNLDIIKRGLKKIHALAAGTNPSSVQAADAMTALQSLIVEILGQGSLGRLNDVLATADYTARENDRIQASDGITITLPTIITTDSCSPYPYLGGSWCALGPSVGYWDYGSLSSGPGRPPRDRSVVVVITDGDPVYNIWSTYKNAWFVVNTLAQTDDFPFADYLENGFAALLAERLVDDYAQQLGAETKSQANACRYTLSCKPDSASRSAAACFF